MRQSAPGQLESNVEDDDILIRQLRNLYTVQQNQNKKLDKRRKFLRKLKIIFGCCL